MKDDDRNHAGDSGGDDDYDYSDGGDDDGDGPGDCAYMMIDTFITSIRKQLGKLGPKNWHLACCLLQLFKFILETVGSE